MLNTSVTTVTAVQGSERQHLKDEGQGVAKELSNEVDVPRKIRRKLEVWHGNITMKGIRIAFWMTAKRYLKKHEIKQNVFCLIFYTLRHVVCVFSFLKWSRMIWLPNESCIIGPRQVTTRLILRDWIMDEDVEHCMLFPKGFNLWFALFPTWIQLDAVLITWRLWICKSYPLLGVHQHGATNARSAWGVDLSLTSATKHKERGQQHRRHLFHGKVLDSIGMMWLFMTLDEENHIISYLKQYSCPWIHGDSQCQSDLDLFVFASPLNADWKTATMISRGLFVRGFHWRWLSDLGIHRKNENKEQRFQTRWLVKQVKQFARRNGGWIIASPRKIWIMSEIPSNSMNIVQVENAI